jgi:hypothetical protein
MARILIVVLFTCFVLSIFAQPPSKNFLYINDKDKYVLSETAEIKDGYGRSTYQTFNSLFIWQKDKVVRIVFKYLKRRPGHVLAKQQLFSRFIPPFKKYTIYARAVSHPAGVYDGEIVYGKKSEYNADNYTELFKTAINNWNRKYNPYADMLGGIIVLDGYSDPLCRNKKRKGEYNNNLPVLFTMGDSSYLIKPYVINVYRLSSRDHIPAAINNVVCYKLYSTVSLMEDSFPDSYQEHSFPY